MNQSYAHPNLAANVAASERALFIQRTYNHLAGAVLAFVGISFIIQKTGLALTMTNTMLGSGRASWAIVLIAFIGVSWIAENWARSSTSRETQYMGLALYVVAQAIIFVPLLYIANNFAQDPNLIAKAGITTLGLVAGITIVAFTSNKDFSFLGGFLRVASLVAFGFIICSMIFGFHVGNIFAALMVLMAGGFLLYDTSNVIRHYRTDQYVAASLALFASIALMLWYIIQLFMSSGE
ncbi:Bax inhibitor-1/YccA family protein [Candidatus Uabimicrobium amorphum]|uniref:Permease n=1 Tax=Uabimicrobium amorphum TaxID=2596890 RepID=A0A5S9IIG6_UABAM|nr:Bax inhibitor-1 family protein [Candidatus Uabimicrobium amorphum]BBM82403.1 permease [Candidatus Uabimicrobium amorphum]